VNRLYKYLVLFFCLQSALFLGACESNMCGGPSEVDVQELANLFGPTVHITFDKEVFANKDYTFQKLGSFPIPSRSRLLYKGGNTCYKILNWPGNGVNPPSKCGYMPVPTDSKNFGFVINYKDSFIDTLTIEYHVILKFEEKNTCDQAFAYHVIQPVSFNCTNRFVKVLVVNEGFNY
jgi:hypothetical protein